MLKRVGLILALPLVAMALASCSSTSHQTLAVQIDAATTSTFNLEAIAYFPDKLTAHPGDTLQFHSNFRGEPHTVTFGAMINRGLAALDKLTPQQQQLLREPPPEAKDIPQFFPLGDPATTEPGQSAAQPCFLDSGVPPPTKACPKRAQPDFTGTQAFYSSGWVGADQTYSMKLASDLKPGTYQWICLVHGPEMRGKLTVVAKGQKADKPAAVTSAGQKKLDGFIAKLKPVAAKAGTDAKPGEVSAGIGIPNDRLFPAGGMTFAPKVVSIPVGGTVTWNLSFHTVSFNAPEDARPAFVKAANGTVSFNRKAIEPANSPKPPEPAQGSPNGPPPPVTFDGGTWDGTGFHSSGSANALGDFFYKLTFTKAGTYKYECLIHPDMLGTVKVG